MKKQNELQYKERFTEREHWIMHEREYNKASYESLSITLGISRTRASQIYNHAKRRQQELYVQAIIDAEGGDAERSWKRSSDLTEQFGDHLSAVAYLEKEYADILDAFRNGEPPSGCTYNEVNHEFHRQAIVISSDEIHTMSEVDREFYEPDGDTACYRECYYRIKLNETELYILRENKAGKGFERIARQLGITKRLVRVVYQEAFYVQVNMKLLIIKNATGKSISKLRSEIPKDINHSYMYLKILEYLEKAYESILSSCES